MIEVNPMPSSFTFEAQPTRLYRAPELLYSNARIPYSKARVAPEEDGVPYSLALSVLYWDKDIGEVGIP